MSDEVELRKLKVVELRNLLEEKNLSTIGKKDELIERLLESVKSTQKKDITDKKIPTITAEISSLDYEEKKALRAKRFNIDYKPSDMNINKNSNIINNKMDPIEIEKLKKRQERFGVTVSSVLKQTEIEETKLKRMERFNK